MCVCVCVCVCVFVCVVQCMCLLVCVCSVCPCTCACTCKGCGMCVGVSVVCTNMLPRSVVHVVCGGEVCGGCGGGVACSVCTGRQILFYKRE